MTGLINYIALPVDAVWILRSEKNFDVDFPQILLIIFDLRLVHISVDSIQT